MPSIYKTFDPSELEKRFPFTNPEGTFALYPFSNEIITTRKGINIFEKLAKKTSKIREVDGDTKPVGAALLFGESHFLSLLPHFKDLGIQLVILADIEPLSRDHTKCLINCFDNAENIESFMQLYQVNNPIEHKDFELADLMDCLKSNSNEPGHFLFDENAFNNCKKAREGVQYAHIQLDLLDKIACQKLGQWIYDAGMCFKFLNLTNIHHYDPQNKRRTSVTSLLHYSKPENYFMMFSVDLPGNREAFLRLNAKLKTKKPLEKYFKLATYENVQTYKNKKLQEDKKLWSIQNTSSISCDSAQRIKSHFNFFSSEQESFSNQKKQTIFDIQTAPWDLNLSLNNDLLIYNK
ncbi:MAG: hypothetical protein H2069_07150 [Legionella sp.]|nr:hypothetical protein [Legionella sp.]